jgi:hypothetical protein
MNDRQQAIKIYQVFDPSGKPRKLIGKAKNQAEAKAFRDRYTKGLFDRAVSEAKGRIK